MEISTAYTEDRRAQLPKERISPLKHPLDFADTSGDSIIEDRVSPPNEISQWGHKELQNRSLFNCDFYVKTDPCTMNEMG